MVLDSRMLHALVRSGKSSVANLRNSGDAAVASNAPSGAQVTTDSAYGVDFGAAAQVHDRRKPRTVRPTPLETRPLEPARRPAPRWRIEFDTALLVLDVFCIAIAQLGWILLVADWIGPASWGEILTLVTITTVLDVLFLFALGAYLREALLGLWVQTTRTVSAIALSGALFFFAVHFLLAPAASNGEVPLTISASAMLALVSASLSLGSVALSRSLIRAMVVRRFFVRRLLVIGSGSRAARINQMMTRMPYCLLNDVIVVPESAIGIDATAFRAHPPRTPDATSIASLSRELEIDEIVVASDEGESVAFEPLLACKANGIIVSDYNSFVERETNRIDLSRADRQWLVYSRGFRISLLNTLLKRTLDIAVSLTLLIVSGPVLLASMTAIAITRDGPIFFRQQRVTQDGRIFWIYKLRTMRCDAEARGPQWSHANDSRITPVGAILRRFRIDEIPQLINVLCGDMSLVGPRPEQPHFVQELSREIPLYNVRHAVKAGITGWAQINYPYGASKSDAERKLEYDLYYIKNYSFFREISILLQTVRVLFWPPRAD